MIHRNISNVVVLLEVKPNQLFVRLNGEQSILWKFVYQERLRKLHTQIGKETQRREQALQRKQQNTTPSNQQYTTPTQHQASSSNQSTAGAAASADKSITVVESRIPQGKPEVLESKQEETIPKSEQQVASRDVLTADNDTATQKTEQSDRQESDAERH